jgi:hypothetical protein
VEDKNIFALVILQMMKQMNIWTKLVLPDKEIRRVVLEKIGTKPIDLRLKLPTNKIIDFLNDQK